jgi:hypothetical protein
MGIARSAFYDQSAARHDDTAIVEAIASICEEFDSMAGGVFAPSCGIGA